MQARTIILLALVVATVLAHLPRHRRLAPEGNGLMEQHGHQPVFRPRPGSRLCPKFDRRRGQNRERDDSSEEKEESRGDNHPDKDGSEKNVTDELPTPTTEYPDPSTAAATSTDYLDPDAPEVTECQDCLAELYPQLTYRKTLNEIYSIEQCQTNVNSLNECLIGCRPSDPMAVVASLRMIYISQNHNGCYNRTLVVQDCDTIHSCLLESLSESSLFLGGQTVERPLNCDPDAMTAIRTCYDDLASQCSYADFLKSVTTSGLDEHCFSSGCIYQTNNDIYRTVAGSDCKQYTMQGVLGRISGPFNVAAGTVMDTRPDFCVLNHEGIGQCFN